MPVFGEAVEAVNAPVAHELAGTRWLLEDIRNTGVIDHAQSTLHFDGEGRVSGSGGCNRMGGGVTLDGASVRFGPLMSTRMACVEALMDQEQRYLATLADVRAYLFEHEGAILHLLDEAGEKILRFSRMGE